MLSEAVGKVEASPGRVPYKRVPKCGSLCKGSCRGIANMGAADASRRFAYCSFMVGTLPSRRLAAMSLYWQHLATPDVVDELFVTCLPTSSVLTSADVVISLPTKPLVLTIRTSKAFALGEKVSRSDG